MGGYNKRFYNAAFAIVALLSQINVYHVTLHALSISTGKEKEFDVKKIGTNESPYESSLNLDVVRLRQTISSGRVYVHKNFLTEDQVRLVRREMEDLKRKNCFQASGLSKTDLKSKADQNFNSNNDRAICNVPWWIDSVRNSSFRLDARVQETETETIKSSDGICYLKNEDVSSIVGNKLQNLRLALAEILTNRTTMADPNLAHECYYSQSEPGSFLKRHMDERHEETKGARGWLLPSRRSISWLVYVSDDNVMGGELRTFPIAREKYATKHKMMLQQYSSFTGIPGLKECGSHDGNLQVGWLISNKLSQADPIFLDSWYIETGKKNGENPAPLCILYRVTTHQSNDGIDRDRREYITRPWSPDSLIGNTVPYFLKETARAESFTMNDIFLSKKYAESFRLIEDRERWSSPGDNKPEASVIEDISPERGSLVLFDSVTLPHEVRPVLMNTRAAIAGWFHEETQPFPEYFG